MVALFDGWIYSLGGAGFWMLAMAAMVEYLFPPFPGDTVILLGGVYAIRGERSWLGVFAAITLGSLLGAAMNYLFGRLIARHVDRQPEGKAFFGLSHARIRELQGKMQRRGDLIILLNRFLPGVRSLLFVAAGASRLGVGRVLLLGAASAIGWNFLLFGVGLAVGGNAERLEAFLRSYQHFAWGAVGVLAVALAARFFYRARRRRRGGGACTPTDGIVRARS